MLDRRTHRWFARYWNWQLRSENDQFIAMRRDVASGAGGRVLEVGCGPGSNFQHYGRSLSQLVALDPNPYMLGIARTKTMAQGRAALIRGKVEALPFKDGAFATVVSTANFCSVGHPENGLAEIRRVLQPGEEYRFFDHVRSEDSRALAFFQDAITPIHRRLLGAGCRPNRRIGHLVAAAGFSSLQAEMRKPLPVIPMAIYRPHIIGVARR
jgi:ubiquinone/menaquinone biosynthesis C-methylase UbiE